MTSLSKERPFEVYKSLHELKYDLIESGVEIEYFRASEDRQAVRDSVFNLIQSHLTPTRIDSLIVEKRKTDPALQIEERFYPEMLGCLLHYVVNSYDLDSFHKVIVFTDNIPIQRKRRAVEKAIKMTLSRKLPPAVSYFIFHHASKSSYDLQVVDYCNWAVYRRWERADQRSYEIIKEVVASEIDIFKTLTACYY